MAKRFVDAWAKQDFAAMHEELSPSAQEKYGVNDLASQYLEAQQASTAVAIAPGDADEPTSANGTDIVDVEIGIRTRLFGRVDGTLRLPLDGEKIAWEPHLTFPNLQSGERVGRRLTLPRRASILAKNGTPLARGPVGNRTSPLGSDAVDVAGETGVPDAELRAKIEREGYPADQEAGVSGLELAFNSRLAGRPGGQLLAVEEGAPPTGRPEERRRAGPRHRPRSTGTGHQDDHRARPPGDDGQRPRRPLRRRGRPRCAKRRGPRPGRLRLLLASAPGSIFKVITTTAGLEQKEVKLDEYFEPVSEINPDPENGARVIENNEGEVCGGTFVQSFAHSCNTVFAPLGADVGGKALVDTAERYGFNQEPTLYDAEATAAAQPGKMTIPKELGSATDITATAIGQGRVLATPLGMASVAQTVAAGEAEPDADRRRSRPSCRRRARRGDVSRERPGADRADAGRRHQRHRSRGGDPEDPGRGQDRHGGARAEAESAAPSTIDPETGEPELEQIIDAWFIAFAPANKPKLAIAVMLIDAPGDGGQTAAPIAQDILSAALSK